MEVTRFVQISDTHIFANKQGALLGVNTWDSLSAVVDMLVNFQNEYDFVIHSGDLSQDQSILSYQHIAECLNALGKPIYFIPGNHDDPLVMEKVFPQGNWQSDKRLLFGNWQILLLNSQQTNQVKGYLGQSELAFLSKHLTDNPNKYALIFFHHHPTVIGCAWLDPLGIQNNTEFWQTIKSFTQLKGVFFGHVHQEFEKIVNQIPCYSVPSTCIQFKPRNDSFSLDKIPQGCRFVSLYNDGSIKTHVKRIDQYVGHFDASAKGY